VKLPEKIGIFGNLPGKIEFFYPHPRPLDFKTDWRHWLKWPYYWLIINKA